MGIYGRSTGIDPVFRFGWPENNLPIVDVILYIVLYSLAPAPPLSSNAARINSDGRRIKNSDEPDRTNAVLHAERKDQLLISVVTRSFVFFQHNWKISLYICTHEIYQPPFCEWLYYGRWVVSKPKSN